MTVFVFVGEQRSQKAQQMGVTWESGHLAAATLHGALREAGIDPSSQEYRNLWTDAGEFDFDTLDYLCSALAAGLQLVALGQKVSRELDRRSIPHIRMVHPAARGSIRKTERYRAHVRGVLANAC